MLCAYGFKQQRCYAYAVKEFEAQNELEHMLLVCVLNQGDPIGVQALQYPPSIDSCFELASNECAFFAMAAASSGIHYFSKCMCVGHVLSLQKMCRCWCSSPFFFRERRQGACHNHFRHAPHTFNNHRHKNHNITAIPFCSNQAARLTAHPLAVVE